MGIIPKRTTGRKAVKEIKSKCKRTRGKEIAKLRAGKLNARPGEIKKIKEEYYKNYLAGDRKSTR